MAEFNLILMLIAPRYVSIIVHVGVHWKLVKGPTTCSQGMQMKNDTSRSQNLSPVSNIKWMIYSGLLLHAIDE